MEAGRILGEVPLGEALLVLLIPCHDHAAGFGVKGSPKVGFLIEKSDQSVPSHLAFAALDESAVGRFHQAGIEHGFTCNGKPGLRKNYAPNYYAAFLLDPDGNNVEAVVYLSK